MEKSKSVKSVSGSEPLNTGIFDFAVNCFMSRYFGNSSSPQSLRLPVGVGTTRCNETNNTGGSDVISCVTRIFPPGTSVYSGAKRSSIASLSVRWPTMGTDRMGTDTSSTRTAPLPIWRRSTIPIWNTERSPGIVLQADRTLVISSSASRCSNSPLLLTIPSDCASSRVLGVGPPSPFYEDTMSYSSN